MRQQFCDHEVNAKEEVDILYKGMEIGKFTNISVRKQH